MKCDWCDGFVHPEDAKHPEDDLPEDIPWPADNDIGMTYHRWCFENYVIPEMRQEMVAKYEADNYPEPTEADEWHSFDPDC